MNLYMKMNNSSEKIRLAASTQPGISLAFLFFFFSSFWISSSETSAENLSAFMPSDMAWNSVPMPRKIGYLKIGYLSDMRGSGISSVTISPLALRTATQ